jgi:NADH-quinone oxidoreductase subunit N
MNTTSGLLNVVYLDSFSVFPEYFIGISCIYLLIVVVLITYNVYGLMIQKSLSECIALILFMACYLLINDDLLTTIGNHSLTFNNSIITDNFSLFTKFVVCFSSAIYFLIISNFLKQYRLTSFEYLLITLFAVLGLMLMCSSNDLLTAYLAIELSSLAFYILASFKKTSSYSIESGLKYFVTGAISSSFYLLGSSFIYSQVGTINFFDISRFTHARYISYRPSKWLEWQLSETDLTDYLSYMWYTYWDPLREWTDFSTSFMDLGVALIIFSLFIKLGLAPFHLWSLDVYEGSPTTATFFFAVISKLSIFVILVRFSYHLFVSSPNRESWSSYALIIAVLSIFVGSFGGLQTRKLKTLLAYSSTSHMGYVILAFSTGQQLIGVEMIFFYLTIYIMTGLATWFIILSLILKTKTESKKYNKELGDLVLLHKSNAALAFAFALTMFSTAGIPPMIGFIAKMGVFFSVILSGMDLNVEDPWNTDVFADDYRDVYYPEYFVAAFLAILCSVLSTFYYIRIIKILYFENTLVGKLYYPINNQKILILSILIFLLIFLFINPTLLHLIVYYVAINFPHWYMTYKVNLIV